MTLPDHSSQPCQTSRTRPRAPARQRGVAMIEVVLCLPLLLTVLVLLMYFGVAGARLVQTRVAAGQLATEAADPARWAEHRPDHLGQLDATMSATPLPPGAANNDAFRDLLLGAGADTVDLSVSRRTGADVDAVLIDAPRFTLSAMNHRPEAAQLADAVFFTGQGGRILSAIAKVNTTHEGLGVAALGEARRRAPAANQPAPLLRDVMSHRMAAFSLTHASDWSIANGWFIRTIPNQNLFGLGYDNTVFRDDHRWRLLNVGTGFYVDITGDVIVQTNDAVHAWHRMGDRVQVEPAIRDAFYVQFDSVMLGFDNNLPSVSRPGVTGMARRLILHTPSYFGPSVFRPSHHHATHHLPY